MGRAGKAAEMGLEEDPQFLSLGDERNDGVVCRIRNVRISFGV